ncbi:MAG: thiamine pyrophosphate-binding protein, partial [Halobacteriales archaeon]
DMTGTQRPGGEFAFDALLDAGIELLVGLPGTQTLPLDRVVAARDDIRYVMARNETAIPHVAWGYHEAGGGLAATLTVPGPGETNAMHGLKNALEDCVPIVHVSADADPGERGKGPIHEIEPDTYENVLKANRQVDRPGRLREHVTGAIEDARAPPTGPVRVGAPSSFLADDVTAPAADVDPGNVAFDASAAIAEAIELLATADRPLLYVGGGCRRTEGGAAVARDLADALDCPVLASYKGKGVVPDGDPRVLGVSAKHLNAGGKHVLDRADVVLALGPDFDGLNTADWTLPMGDTVIHVNVDPGAFGRSYDADIEVPGDAAEIGRAILEGLTERDPGGWDGPRIGEVVREEYDEHLADLGVLDDGAPAKTPATLRAIREGVPGEAVVTTDIGGHRLWALQVFAATRAENYVTAGSWAGMGVGLPAAIGAALAREDPVVALHGDGGLMMCLQELHTAAEEDLDITLVVFANADYGIISKSSEISAYAGEGQFAWDPPDFAGIAEAFDCRGTNVETPGEAADAVAAAVGRSGPDVVVVDTDPDEPSVVEAADYESTVVFP